MNKKLIYRISDTVITTALLWWLSTWGWRAVGVGFLLALWSFIDGLVRGRGYLD